MKRECPQCGFELREMSWEEKFHWEKLERAEHNDQLLGEKYTGFDIWLECRPGTSVYVDGLESGVTLVEAKTDYSYEYADNMVYVVVKVDRSGDHFIIHGSRDSYGNATWDLDSFREVSQQTRTMWIWQENA